MVNNEETGKNIKNAISKEDYYSACVVSKTTGVTQQFKDLFTNYKKMLKKNNGIGSTDFTNFIDLVQFNSYTYAHQCTSTSFDPLRYLHQWRELFFPYYTNTLLLLLSEKERNV